MKTVLVIGLGISGKASALLLLSRGFSVIGADRRWETLVDDPEVKQLIQKGLQVVSDEGMLPVTPFSFCVVSPGIEPSHPLLKSVQKQNIETIGEIELAFRYLPNRHILGVTGSNGKTTTVLLTAHILNTLGKKAKALGNVGAALSGYAVNPDPEEILVIELSSFQMESLTLKPRFDTAAILNITPNHLNRHASMQEYAAAKLRIKSCLKPNGKLFISKQVARDFQIQGTIFEKKNAPAFDSEKIRLGCPEWENVEAAIALCSLFEIRESKFFQAMKTFRKPPHRIEWVAEIGGVSYYNDSKASNVEAVMHAVRLFNGPLLLIAGGVDKGASYRPWIDCFQGKVKQIAVFG
ncbi:MAG: UDP-N-acetylmuramoyl-L-alanine--D-glutamate ligase, partial [Chlamydiae bacterium]|nr:UDP-N-acetylmuramoyl-L-alanine--D-glutamate ligase [Chlamydiota bacterium]